MLVHHDKGHTDHLPHGFDRTAMAVLGQWDLVYTRCEYKVLKFIIGH